MAALFLLVGVVLLSSGTIESLIVFAVSLASLGAAVLVKQEYVALDGSHLSYRGVVGGWSLDLAKVRAVDVPMNYRLLYVSIQGSDHERRVAPLNFDDADGLADALLSSLPAKTCSSAAAAVLEGVRAKAPVDSINRAKWNAK